jgi:adenylate cyclase
MWKKLRTHLWEWRVAWFVASSVSGVVLLLRSLALFQHAELSTFDLFVQLRPVEPHDPRIAIVTVDESDVPECCFIPSNTLANLIEKLSAQKPRAIGISIPPYLFGSDGRKKLNRTVALTENLVMVNRLQVKDMKKTYAGAIASDGLRKMSLSNLIIDPDSKIRRGLLYLTDADTGETTDSISLHLARLYLAQQKISSQPLDGKNFQLGKAIFSPLSASYGSYENIEVNGYQNLINYRNQVRGFDTIALTDILKDRVPVDWARDRIVIVGTVSEGFQYPVLTPFSGGMHSLPIPVPKVEVYAQFTSHLISAAIDGRTQIKSWSEPVEWLWVFIWALLGAHTSLWRWRHIPNVRSRQYLLFLAIVLLFCLSLFAISYMALLGGWWIPFLPPLISGMASGFVVTGLFAYKANKIRATFGRYLNDEVVANLLESKEGLKLGGERRLITMLVSDLRGFTATSEHLPPEEVVHVLNIYLEAMADVITEYQGTIDEFMGDGILVLFGAPTVRADDAQRAVACAIAMQLAMDSVNEKVVALGLDKLDMGIGINTGEVVVGNIGSEKRTKYGIVGNQVNLTYRMESYTVGGQILISDRTFAEVNVIAQVSSSRSIQSKGLQHPITIYDIAGIGGAYNLCLPKAEEIYLPLTSGISIRYAVLEGKQIGDEMCRGCLTELSAKGAKVKIELSQDQKLEHPIPAVLSNIKLNFVDENPEATEDCYAKVLEICSEDGFFYIHFTFHPTAIKAYLELTYQSLMG